MLRMLERIARSLLTTGGAIALAGVGLMLIFLGAELFGTVGAIAGIFLAALLVGWVRVMAESIASPKVLVRKTVAMSTRILDATLWLKERLRPKGEAKPKLVAPPAMRIARFLEFVCSPPNVRGSGRSDHRRHAGPLLRISQREAAVEGPHGVSARPHQPGTSAGAVFAPRLVVLSCEASDEEVAAFVNATYLTTK